MPSLRHTLSAAAAAAAAAASLVWAAAPSALALDDAPPRRSATPCNRIGLLGWPSLLGAVAARAGEPSLRPEEKVGVTLTGIDVLARDGFRALRGFKIGLVTNAAAQDRAGRRTVDVLHGARGVALRALFSPEHGLEANADATVRDSIDARTGLRVWSLYGSRRRPAPETLRGLDAIVIDLPDAGARFFTYISTMGYVLEAAAAHGIAVVVLDRPNPIGGEAVEGPLVDAGSESFLGYHAIPIRHGMTIGELAQLFNEERKIGAELHVIEVEGWRRDDTLDRTGIAWTSPSPNLRSLDAALLYPGVALVEMTNVSVGRGTSAPFQRVGAPFVDGAALSEALSARGLPGVRFHATTFTPSSGPHAGAACSGVSIEVTDRALVEPVRLGLALAEDLGRASGGAFRLKGVRGLLRNARAFDALSRGEPIEQIAAGWAGDLAAFEETRRRYLLY